MNSPIDTSAAQQTRQQRLPDLGSRTRDWGRRELLASLMSLGDPYTYTPTVTCATLPSHTSDRQRLGRGISASFRLGGDYQLIRIGEPPTTCTLICLGPMPSWTQGLSPLTREFISATTSSKDKADYSYAPESRTEGESEHQAIVHRGDRLQGKRGIIKSLEEDGLPDLARQSSHFLPMPAKKTE